MPKRKPSQRRKPEMTRQTTRNRRAEIRDEIQDIQQQIEAKRRDRRVIRNAEDFKSMERAGTLQLAWKPRITTSGLSAMPDLDQRRTRTR